MTARILTAILALVALAGSIPSALAQAPPPGDPMAKPPTPAPADARLYIIAPAPGARIRGPVIVQFGLRNMGVTQAGVTTPNTGHHHILVDVKDPPSPTDTPPADRNHIHFGGGQTEARLELPPAGTRCSSFSETPTTGPSGPWCRPRRSRSPFSDPVGRSDRAQRERAPDSSQRRGSKRVGAPNRSKSVDGPIVSRVGGWSTGRVSPKLRLCREQS